MSATLQMLGIPIVVTLLVAGSYGAVEGRRFSPPDDATLIRTLRESRLEGERVAAAMDLGARKRGRAELREALRDRSPRVRFEGAVALARQGDSAGLDALAPAATAPDLDRRARLVAALGFLDDPRAQRLLADLSQHDPDPELREVARRLLRR